MMLGHYRKWGPPWGGPKSPESTLFSAKESESTLVLSKSVQVHTDFFKKSLSPVFVCKEPRVRLIFGQRVQSPPAFCQRVHSRPFLLLLKNTVYFLGLKIPILIDPWVCWSIICESADLWICESLDPRNYGSVDLWKCCWFVDLWIHVSMILAICGSMILRICGPKHLWIYVSVDL